MEVEDLLKIATANITPNVVKTDVVAVHTEPVIPRPVENTVEADAAYVRDTLIDAIEKGSAALRDACEAVNETRHPYSAEAAAILLKNLTNATQLLLKTAKDKKELSGQPLQGSNVNIEKAVFVGSTKDLMKALKEGTTIDGEVEEDNDE